MSRCSRIWGGGAGVGVGVGSGVGVCVGVLVDVCVAVCVTVGVTVGVLVAEAPPITPHPLSRARFVSAKPAQMAKRTDRRGIFGV